MVYRGDLWWLRGLIDAYDQPYIPLPVIKLIQLNYRKHLADKMRKINGK